MRRDRLGGLIHECDRPGAAVHAHRIQLLAAEAAELRAELDRLVAVVTPCPKRVVARQLFKLLERYDHPAMELLGIS